MATEFARSQAIALSCVGLDAGGCYQKYTRPKTSDIAEPKTALLSIWNDLPQEFTLFIDKAMS